MSQTPFEQAGSLRIGTVDFVSPDEIKVALEIEAPDSVALNSGAPRPFPRVNGYVLIPVDDGFVAGQVEWLTVERSPFPKRRGMRDFGLVDLPYPLRRMSLNPLGTLRAKSGKRFVFQRGADALPSVGAPVVLPTETQLRSIVESGERRHVKIGTSPLAGDAEVKVDPNRLFGRHLAVLGNTGSGKSCSVAGLIRWSLEQARSTRAGQPNARFIVLDPNGEYSRAFPNSDPAVTARIFKVDHCGDQKALEVPLWFWNSAEWCSFTQASTRTQRPTLIHALQSLRDQRNEPTADPGHEMRRFLRTLVSITRIEKQKGTPWADFPKNKSFLEKINKWQSSLEEASARFSNQEGDALQELIAHLEELSTSRKGPHPSYDFTLQEVQALLSKASMAHSAFGGTETDLVPADVDAPIPFEGDSLLRSTEAAAESLNVSEYVETLLIRIRALLADTRMKPIIGTPHSLTLEDWLESYIGADEADNGCISVIDLSLVPTEVVHIFTAVIARMIFEASQRYVKLNGIPLPTALVMEEAHTFLKRYKDDSENQSAASVCCQVFERIAREGRKFGLGLVLSSQRPSELSHTVLSQCNTFLLHRISNDRDQDLVNRLVPDNLRGLLRELPSLPSQSAILLGWASELPVLVRMNDLPQTQQPRSDDPEFWGVWVGEDEEGNPLVRKTDWKRIADDWQGRSPDEDMSREDS